MSEAALVFTRGEGWHLQPSPTVLREVKTARRLYPPPRPRLDRELTARLMREQGYTEAHIKKTLARRPRRATPQEDDDQ